MATISQRDRLTSVRVGTVPLDLAKTRACPIKDPVGVSGTLGIGAVIHSHG
jgi:hypothetical protein